MKTSPATNCIVCMGTGKAPVAWSKYVDCECTKPSAAFNLGPWTAHTTQNNPRGVASHRWAAIADALASADRVAPDGVVVVIEDREALRALLQFALHPPKHKFWGAGEKDCPREIKAGNGELHTLRCKVCGEDNPCDDRCLPIVANSGELSGVPQVKSSSVATPVEPMSNDQRRRNAITEWWERQSLRDFIARKRAALANQRSGSNG